MSDLCEVYKYTHDLYKNGLTDMFNYSKNQLRGHPLKLQKKYCRTSIRQHFFSERVIATWNGLPSEVVMAPSLASFKHKLNSLPLFSTE